MTENDISRIVFECGLRIHKKLGVGLSKETYLECLAFELQNEGVNVELNKSMAVEYEQLYLENAFKVDMLIEGKVILDIKLIENFEVFDNFDLMKMKNYLKILDYKLAMILNFNSQLFKNGIKRVTNGLERVTTETE